MSRAKLATPVGLLVAAAVFFGVFLLLDSLLWAVVIAALAAIGVYVIMDDRSRRQVSDDRYAEDADRKAAEVLRTVREIGRLAREVRRPAARGSLESACGYVPELLARVRENAPDSLYSTASTIGAHLTSLVGAVRQYLDIQRHPRLYPEPQALLERGEEAFRRFTEFAFDSIQLVNQGDLARYQANLETVAPPKLPELG